MYTYYNLNYVLYRCEEIISQENFRERIWMKRGKFTSIFNLEKYEFYYQQEGDYNEFA